MTSKEAISRLIALGWSPVPNSHPSFWQYGIRAAVPPGVCVAEEGPLPASSIQVCASTEWSEQVFREVLFHSTLSWAQPPRTLPNNPYPTGTT